MGLFDLFRPKWKHSDAEVRARAVRLLDDDAILAQVAQGDPDDRVRKVAIKRLLDTEVLAAVAKDDADEGVRRAAQDKLAELAMEAALAGGKESEALAAVARIQTSRALADVALKATQARVRLDAAQRLTDQRALADVVKGTADDAVRAEAWRKLDEPAVLRDLALGDATKGVALQAVDRLGEAAALEAVAKGASNKAVRTAARRKADALKERKAPPRVHEEPAEAEERRQAREAALAAQRRAEEARKHQIVQLRATEEAARKAHAAKSRAAPGAAERRQDEERKEQEQRKSAAAAERERERVERTARDAERAARDAERATRDAERERVTTERDAERERRRVERQADEERNLKRLEELCVRLETLLESTDLKLIDETLRTAQNVFRDPGPLPRTAGSEVRDRYEKSRAQLRIRSSELREADEWKRWSNVPRFEALCGRAEALLQTVETPGADLKQGAADLKALQAEWKALGGAPRERSEALWNRFRHTCDLVHGALRGAASGRQEEREQNLKLKEELCARAEAVQESADFDETALLIKNLQEEWKAVGPVPKADSDAIWKRFRAACDHFFTRRDGTVAPDDPQRQEALRLRQAIADEAESLKDSTDWNVASTRLKALQLEWKTLPPAPRAAADEIWKQFRAACNHFFARRKARFDQLDEEREQNLGDKEELCVRAETAAQGGVPDVEEARRLMLEWKAIGPVPKVESDRVWQRFRTAMLALRGTPGAAGAPDSGGAATEAEPGATPEGEPAATPEADASGPGSDVPPQSG
ncbi:MAG: DUF349 domain-containing protein [Deltaproteobacteria bacterium]|nr:DUF349 domain-containing protein [Deltaproteobacteria bacterium]